MNAQSNQTANKPRVLPDTRPSPEDEAKAKANAEKASNFKRLASARVGKAIAAITIIGHLSARSSYVYTPEQIAKIEAALLEAVRATLERFKADKPTAAAGFNLD